MYRGCFSLFYISDFTKFTLNDEFSINVHTRSSQNHGQRQRKHTTKDAQSNTRTEREKDKQRDGQTERRTDSEKDRQRDREG